MEAREPGLRKGSELRELKGEAKEDDGKIDTKDKAGGGGIGGGNNGGVGLEDRCDTGGGVIEFGNGSPFGIDASAFRLRHL